MGIYVVPFQPVHFPETGQDFNTLSRSCVQDYRTFCQLVVPNQLSQFVLQVTEVSGNNLVTNGQFITDLSSWGVSGFKWSNAGNGSAQAAANGGNMSQAITFAADRTYKIKYVFTKLDNTPFQLDFVVGGGGNVIGGKDTVNQTDEQGEYDFFVRDTSGAGILGITYTSSQLASVWINSVEVYELTEPIVQLRDSNDTVIDTLTAGDRYKNYVTFENEWTQDNDTYKFCITNAEDLSFNYLGCAFALNWGTGAPILVDGIECLHWYG